MLKETASQTLKFSVRMLNVKTCGNTIRKRLKKYGWFVMVDREKPLLLFILPLIQTGVTKYYPNLGDLSKKTGSFPLFLLQIISEIFQKVVNMYEILALFACKP